MADNVNEAEKISRIKEVNDMWKAYNADSKKFSSEHRAMLQQANKDIIEQVARGKYKLDKSETKDFKDILGHAPAMVQAHVDHNRPLMGPVSDTKEQRHYKQAEQILYNVENGIEKVSLKDKARKLAATGATIIIMKQGELSASIKGKKEKVSAFFTQAKNKAKERKAAIARGVKDFGKDIADGAQYVGGKVAQGARDFGQGVADGATIVAGAAFLAGDAVVKGAGKVKTHVSEKVGKLKSKGVAVSRLSHRKFNKARDNVKGIYKSAKNALIAWQQRRAEAKLKREEERLKRIEARKKEAERKREEARKRRAERLNKLKTGLGNFWKGTKKVATDITLGTGYAVVTPFVWGFKGAKAAYNGAKWVRGKYQEFAKAAKDKAQERKAIRDRAISINKVRTAKNKKEAEKSAMKTNLDELTPAQIAANWSFLGSKQSVLDKETDGYYRMKAKSHSVMNSIVTGELKLTKENASAVAEWLKINMDVQDKVNHNKVEGLNKRNNFVAEQLKEFGIDVKGKTKETEAKQAEAQTPEIATPEQAKQEDPLKSIDPAQMQKIDDSIKNIRDITSKNKELGEAFAKNYEQLLITPKDKGGLGLNEAQINAIKANNTDLFPKEENKKAQPVNSSEEVLARIVASKEQGKDNEHSAKSPEQKLAKTIAAKSGVRIKGKAKRKNRPQTQVNQDVLNKALEAKRVHS